VLPKPKVVLDLLIESQKHTSALRKPINKLGFLILIRSTQGFILGILLGKLTESISLKPLFLIY